jgi:hypothetical protein
VIYGQGTLALEMFEQTDAKLAALVVPTGGGGMLAGSALASLLVSPSTKLFAVEPSGYDDHCQRWTPPSPPLSHGGGGGEGGVPWHSLVLKVERTNGGRSVFNPLPSRSFLASPPVVLPSLPFCALE